MHSRALLVLLAQLVSGQSSVGALEGIRAKTLLSRWQNLRRSKSRGSLWIRPRNRSRD